MGKLLFTKAEIDALPTILDVVESMSARENQLILPMVSQIPSPDFYEEGRFNYVSEKYKREIVHLMPTSQSPFTYYRGQSRYHDPCMPSLYRKDKNGKMPTEEDIAYNRLKICEFSLLLESHPVFRELCQNIFVDYVAMAQHYGLTTEFLDVTNSKWVAAFFACTGYDWKTDAYYPVGREYHEGFGVMYITNWDVGNLPEEFYEKNGVIGYQYFARPTKQSSFGYRMEKGENFNRSPFFKKIFFRHDLEASTIVYEMSYRQKRFIPKDSLSTLARKISESKEVTRWAHFRCWESFYQDREPAFLDKVCSDKGLTIREDNMPVARFGDEELAADWKQWNEFGREDLTSRILPIIPITTIDLSKLSEEE